MTSPLAGLARSWWEWCAAVSLELAVLTLIVAMLDRLLRRRASPGILAALWLLPILKLLLPPGLGSPVSLSGVSGSPWLLEAPPRLAEREVVAAFLMWFAGCCLLGAACVRRYRGLRRDWLGGTPRPAPASVEALAREAAERIGLERLPEVRIVAGAPGPAVVGFLRPVVVLPARLVETGAREDLAHVILHELAHVMRRDPLVQLLSLVAQVVFWFHPSIWLARRRLSSLAELCSDETVAEALGGSTAAYRRTLLRLARPALATRAFGSLAFFRRRSQLLPRIERLERLDRRASGARGGRLLFRRGLAAGLCAAVLFSVPPVRSRAGMADLSLPPLESLHGCLQLRYAVQAALARRSLDPESIQPPGIQGERRS